MTDDPNNPPKFSPNPSTFKRVEIIPAPRSPIFPLHRAYYENLDEKEQRFIDAYLAYNDAEEAARLSGHGALAGPSLVKQLANAIQERSIGSHRPPMDERSIVAHWEYLAQSSPDHRVRVAALTWLANYYNVTKAPVNANGEGKEEDLPPNIKSIFERHEKIKRERGAKPSLPSLSCHESKEDDLKKDT